LLAYKKSLLQIVISLLAISVVQLPWAAEKDLVLPDLNGKQINISDFKGKWVIVNYWATWCPPCAVEIPELNAFHKKHQASDAVVIGVNIEKEDIDYVKEFVADFKVVYPVLIADNLVSSPYGRVTALPTTFVIARDGTLFQKIVGGVTQQQLEDIIVGK